MHIHQSSLDLASCHANHPPAGSTASALASGSAPASAPASVSSTATALASASSTASASAPASVEQDAAMQRQITQLLQQPHLLFCILPFLISHAADPASPLTMLRRVPTGSTPDTPPPVGF